MSENKDKQDTFTRADALRLRAESKELADAAEYAGAYAVLFQELEKGDEAQTLLDKLDYWHEHKAAQEVLLLLTSDAASKVLSGGQQGRVAAGLGAQYRSLGQHSEVAAYYPQAQEQLTRAQTLLKGAGAERVYGDVLAEMGIIAIEQQREDEGFSLLQQALQLYQQLDLRRRFAICVYSIGWAHYKVGEYDKAAEYYARTVELCRQIPHPAIEASAHEWLGETHIAMGEYRRAFAYFEQAMAVRPDDDTFGAAMTLYGLAVAHWYGGSLWRALAYFEQAQDLFTQIHNSYAASCQNHIGTIYGRLGQRKKRMECHQQALVMAEEYDDVRHKAEVLRSIGEAYVELGEYNVALEHYHQALSLYKRAGQRIEEGNTHNFIGNAYARQYKYEAAIEAYQQALAVWQEIGRSDFQAASLNGIGKTYSYMGERVIALEYYQQALELYDKLPHRKGRAETLTNIALAYQNLNRWGEALKYHLRSFTG